MRFQSLLRLWESVQVELHGQHSVARFEELVQYQARHTSRLRALAIAILGPLPLLLLLISVDALPLAPIMDGLSKQTFGFWVRTILIGWLTPFSVICQIWHVVPALPMSRIRLWMITAISTAGTCTISVLCILLVDFPVPFSIQLEAIPFLVILSTILWICWKDTLKIDSMAREDLKRYLNVLNAEVAMLAIYLGFTLAFNRLRGPHQTLLSCLLPPIKLLFKNCVSRGTFHLEDLSPTIVVFSVDVFHALFVSFNTQQASAIGASVVVMAADVVQSCVAYYELSRVLDSIHVLTDQATRRASIASRRRGSESACRLMISVIDYAAYVLSTNEKVRNHPNIAMRRPLNRSDLGAPVDAFVSQRKSCQQKASASSVAPTIEDLHTQSQPTGSLITDQDTRRLSEHLLRHVKCTKSVLKLMHMLEFYVLVEYVEAVLSVSYAAYMLILSYLPSHQYYTQLSHLSSTQLRATAWHVGVFAAAEVLSLVVFAWAVDRKVKHFSTLQHLAFALETNGKLIYAVSTGIVFLVVQLSLEHFGSDYTFQFKWLKHTQLPS